MMMSRKGSIGSGSTRSNSTISISSAPRDTGNLQKLQPCSASNDYYIFTQGASVIVVRHDSLALERRFEGHTEEVTVIAVDNSSGTLPTRIVTVDTSKTAIIWSLENGEEISRFGSYDDIQSAAWMKNGNLAFGDSIGNVILFDPIRAESISARTIFDPLVTIAPSGNCKAFALGYNNGSVLIAALSPSFTILHTLTTTSISPSPIVGLAWHASSSKQTSDMLAVQTRDGDLRVWSVPKSIEGDESARVVRVLKRVDGNGRGINWLGWSRNGRIVQYSAGETYIWDVRTKNVEWEYVPTPNNVIGMCIYGPKGALFTLGRDNTVQQFALYPPQLLASFQHAPALLPPSPPASIEEIKNQTINNGNHHSPQEIILLLDEEPPHVAQNEYMMAAAPPPPPELQPMAMAPAPPMPYQHQQQLQLEPTVYADAGLGISNVGMREQRPSSVSSRSSTGSNGSNRERTPSVSSKGSGNGGNSCSGTPGRVSEYSSPPTAVSTPAMGRKGSTGSGYDVIISSPTSGPSSRKQSLGAASIASVQTTSSRKMHPLRQEIHPSPDTPQTSVPQLLPEVTDIFAHLRARLATVTYESPRQGAPQNRLSDDDLRKEMLFCVFGWRGDIEQLIGDELDSVNARSINSLILRMWLGDLDQNSLSVMLGADFNVSGDWLFLALSAMAGQNSWTHVARAYVLKLLQKNDIHMAVLCLLAIGDKNDAVEVYISHNCYLEAVLLTTLLWKNDWKKISSLVRKWGEFAVHDSDANLARRCFACAGHTTVTEPPNAPLPPIPQRSRTPSHSRSLSDNEPRGTIGALTRKLSISSPTNPRATLKMTPKNAPLKLITDFAAAPDPIQRSQTTSPSSGITGLNRFFHPAGIPSRSATSTPIGMSALTPIDPFWQQRDPFPNTRTQTPAVGHNGGKLLTPVTESSPLNQVPHQRLGLDEPLMAPAPPPPPPPGHLSAVATSPPTLLEPPINPAQQVGATHKISSPIEARNSLGFSASPSVTLGDVYKMERAPTPPQMAPPPIKTASPIIPKRTRSMSLRNKVAGLQIQFPPMDQFLRDKDSSKKEKISPPIITRRQTPPSINTNTTNTMGHKDNDSAFLDLVEKGNNRLDSQRAAPPAFSNLRRLSPDRRRRSPERGTLEPRGRTYEIKKSHQRSPSSPLPFSAQAAFYREDPEPSEPEPVEIDSVEIPRPLFNIPQYNEPPARGRSITRETVQPKSPSSPVMSPEQAAHFDERDNGDIDFEDERYYTSPQLQQQSRVPSRMEERVARAPSRMEERVARAPSRMEERVTRAPSRLRDHSMDRERTERTSSRMRNRSPGREHSRARNRSHAREPSRLRDRSIERGSSRIRARSPPPRGSSRLRRASPPRERSRARSNVRAPSVAREWPRESSRERGRSRVKELQGSHLRSPSSPLPMSPQALLYQEMSDEVDRQHEEEERLSRSLRTTSQSRGPRMESRGRQFRNVHETGIRRSRSERTLRQWSDQLEHGYGGGNGGGHYTLRGASPAPSSLSRNLSISRGLPSNPKAWRAELTSRPASPARSAVPRSERALSPSTRHLSPAPYRGRPKTPARELSPAPPLENRAYTPAPYESVIIPTPPIRKSPLTQHAPYESIPPLPAMAMAPAPAQAPYESITVPTLPAKTMNATSPVSFEEVRRLEPAQHPPRSSSRLRSSSRQPGGEERSPRVGQGHHGHQGHQSHHSQSQSQSQSTNPYYNSPHLSSTSDELLPLPQSLNRNNSHKRTTSEPAFKPLIRKLPPMPLSPPPLPNDFPVHQALRMYLEPGKRDRTPAPREGRESRMTSSSGNSRGDGYGNARSDSRADNYGHGRGDSYGNSNGRGDGGYRADSYGRGYEMTPPQLEYDAGEWEGQWRNPEEYYEEISRIEEARRRDARSPAGSVRSRGTGTGERMNMI